MNTNTKFSSRELLVVFTFITLGLVSLRTGGFVVSITVFFAIALGMCMAITAFVGRGQQQAFAIGFSIPVIIYAAILIAVGGSEFHSGFERLPTSRFLHLMYEAIIKPNRWMQTFNSFEYPTFMTLGHLNFALMFGYAGARFAVTLHGNQRTMQGDDAEEAASV